MTRSIRKRTFAGACLTVLCAVAIAIASAGCGGNGDKPKPGTTSNMEVKAGQDFTISLQSNRSTGYQWELDGQLDEKIVKKVSSTYNEQPGGEPGAGGVEVWRFEGVGKGTTDIKMKYVRPSESSNPAEERTFTVTVN